MNSKIRFAVAATALSLFAATHSYGQSVVINELAYDDGGTDDREFVELFNPTGSPVDISGWVLGGRDGGASPNPSATIPANTILAPGAYYVIGNTGVLNVNQVVAVNFLENDAETVELRNAAGILMDGLIYEGNKGPTGSAGYGTLPSGDAASVIGTFWGNNQASDLAGTPLRGSNSIARWVDGRDTNVVGRDFGMRAATPGSANVTTTMTSYTPGTLVSVPTGTLLSSEFAHGFVTARVADPTVFSTINPNVIPDAPFSPGRAIIAWDESGGGNGVTSVATFTSTAAKFEINAYLDTRNFPLQSNSTGVTFRGSEITIYGLGSGDALTNLTDLAGTGALGNNVVSANGFTGVAWVYEKIGETVTGNGVVIEKLYLVDANDGGDARVVGGNSVDWTILATIDLSTVASNWFYLSIDIAADGSGIAKFADQVFNFTTSTALNGSAFSVGYRENLQNGSDGTPDAILRPATFAAVPEPTALALLAPLGLLASRRRRA